MDVCRLIELDIDICRLMGIHCEKLLATAPELEEPLAAGTMKCLARGSSQTEQRISATESGPPCSMPAAMHVSHTHVPAILGFRYRCAPLKTICFLIPGPAKNHWVWY